MKRNEPLKIEAEVTWQVEDADFPGVTYDRSRSVVVTLPFSLRDLFAAVALAGSCAGDTEDSARSPEQHAAFALNCGDAMVAAIDAEQARKEVA